MRYALLFVTVIFAMAANAAPPIREPIDVNVQNDGNSPVPVIIQNDTQTKVTNDENSPVPVIIQNDSQTIVEYRYVGLTEFQTDGNVVYAGLRGIAAMNKVCSDEFGLGTRAANTSEATFRDIGEAETQGWLLPTPPIFPHIGTAEDFQAYDAIGFFAGVSLPAPANAVAFSACFRYTNNDEDLLAPQTTTGANVSIQRCNRLLSVACSAPTIITVSPAAP